MRNLLFFCLFTLLIACETEQQPIVFDEKIDIAKSNLTAASGKIVPLPKVDTAFRPVVMVHGFLASGDTYASFAQRFTSNGYTWRKMFVFDWNSLNQGADNSANLDKFIDNVLKKTGYKQVELMGHSAGGGLCYTYLKEATRAAKVAHYVHIGSSVQSTVAGTATNPVPTINVWSDGDKVAQGGNINGATNVKIPNLDHYQVATSAESFASIYEFFKNEKPKTTNITPEEKPCIGGRVLTFGENQAASAANVKVFETNPLTGERLSATPVYETTTDNDGNWTPVIIKPNTTYEVVAQEKESGKRAIHYYREGFTHNNLFVYLRILPPPGTLAGILLSGLPNNPEQSVLNVFSASQAVISGRDSLIVDGVVHSTPSVAPASKTMIALFLYDGNKNQKSDFTALPLFGTFTFLNGIDQFFDVKKTDAILLKMNNRRLAVRRWTADKDVVVGVFD
jgi:hypothetical protein